MSLTETAILTRKAVSPEGVRFQSLAGVAYRTAQGLPATALFHPEDANISLKLEEHRDEQNRVMPQVAIAYVGAFLDKVIRIGQDDFQAFRFHWAQYPDCFPADERMHFGELLGERWVPDQGGSVLVAHFEPIWGPRLADEAKLRRWALELGVEDREVYIDCPVRVAETIQQYLTHQTWHTHPYVVQEPEVDEFTEMHLQMDRRRRQAAVMARVM
jgi:hypothetical protein